MNAHVPISRYDETAARQAWSEYKDALREEEIARARRIQAHKRFMAAFMGGDA